MLCILCITVPDQAVNIFDEYGLCNNVSEVITKHFWLEPKKEDNNANVICCSCWNTLYSFHEFYKKIEEAHVALSKASLTVDDGLKIEETHVAVSKASFTGDDGLKEEASSSNDHFTECTDLLNAGVKLEIFEDSKTDIAQFDGHEVVDPLKEIKRNDNSDSDSEIPLSKFIKSWDSPTKPKEKQNPTNESDSDSVDNNPGPEMSLRDFKFVKLRKSATKTRVDQRPTNDSDTDSVDNNPQENKEANDDNVNSPQKKMWEATTYSEEIQRRVRSEEFDEFIKQNLQLQCNICYEPQANFSCLREHYMKVHKERGYVSCCDKKFDKRGALVDHVLCHKYPEYFKCDRCFRVLSNRKNLKEHISTIHDKKLNFPCEKCDKNFHRKLLLDRHMDIHVTERKFKCEKCDKLFASKFALGQHNYGVHKGGYMKVCEQCGKVCSDPEAFRRHQLDHTDAPRPFVTCDKCGVRLVNKRGLVRHMRSKHAESKDIHVCSVCGSTASSIYALKRHITYMHKYERSHKCPMCDKGFKRALSLKPSTEDDQTQVICYSCWNALDSFHKFYLKVEEAHMKLVSVKPSIEDDESEMNNFDTYPNIFTEDIKEETFEDSKISSAESNAEEPNENGDSSDKTGGETKSDCESDVPLVKFRRPKITIVENPKESPNSGTDSESEEQNPNQEVSDDEMESKRSGERGNTPDPDLKKKKISCKDFDKVIKRNMKLSCNICHISVASFFILKEHCQSVHNEVAYVTCCDKKFDSRHALAHHIFLHQDPDSFKCKKCSRVLANLKSFKNHMKTHQDAERIYQCNQCKKSFSRKLKLERHMSTHVRLEQICEQCGKVTRDKNALRQHQIREHSGKPRQRLQCAKCGAELADNSTLHTHMKYQHPKTEVVNVCNICGKISTSAYGLKRHIAYMHQCERRHKCRMCEKAFKTAQRLRDKGSALNINEIIVKHFWLQPNADDENAKVICTSCWSALDSFHKFYLQVEEAHYRLQRTNTIEENELKLENEAAQQIHVSDSETFHEVSPELLNADIKLEVQEDAEVTLPPEVSLTDTVKKTEPLKKSPSKRKHSTESKSSVDHEAPPSSSTRSRTSAEKPYTESNLSNDDERNNDFGEAERSNSSPDWHDHNSDSDDEEDDDDSDYEGNASKAKVKKQKEPSKPVTKRGRPKKGEPREPPRKKKRSSEEQSKKMLRIQEYDEMIAQNMKLSCTNCSVIFPNFALLKKHYRVEHNECGYVLCCGKKFRKRGVLVDHIYTHQNPDYFKCEKCGRVLANRKGLDCHMLTHDTEKQRTYQCDQCTMSFYTRPLLTRHLQTHISERNIKCPDCDKFFPTQDILRTHINNVHNAAYTRICDQCGKSFRRPDAFRKHQLEHDGITQPLVPCEKCGVKLTSKYGLKRHMESMHPETEVKHICSTCGKVAPSAAALQRHISYMHKMERKYKCPMCDKAFKKTGGLKVGRDG